MYKFASTKLSTFFALTTYAFSFQYAHLVYLSTQDYAPIFDYKNFDFYDSALLLLALLIYSIFIPRRLAKVSDLFIVVMTLFLYIPITVILLGRRDGLAEQDLILYISLIFAFLLVPCVTEFFGSKVHRLHFLPALSTGEYKKLTSFYLVCWTIFLILFIFNFGSLMSISGTDEIYIQRVIGAAKTKFEGYLQVYFGYVFSLAIFAFGLFQRRLVLKILGYIGCIMLYLVTAEKSVLLIPLMMYIVYLATNLGYKFNFFLKIFLSAYSLVIIVVSIGFEDFPFLGELGFYFFIRIAAIPGALFIDYYDYFSQAGYTHFSNLTGFNYLFSPAWSLQLDPLYPEIPKIIARDVHLNDSNPNANFLASDGAAGFGLWGILMVSAILGIILAFFDRFSRRINPSLSLPLTAPIAYLLTNGSLFTVMASFGGGFLLLLFFLVESGFFRSVKAQSNLHS
jgi:hypothetical protein